MNNESGRYSQKRPRPLAPFSTSLNISCGNSSVPSLCVLLKDASPSPHSHSSRHFSCPLQIHLIQYATSLVFIHFLVPSNAHRSSIARVSLYSSQALPLPFPRKQAPPMKERKIEVEKGRRICFCLFLSFQLLQSSDAFTGISLFFSSLIGKEWERR